MSGAAAFATRQVPVPACSRILGRAVCITQCAAVRPLLLLTNDCVEPEGGAGGVEVVVAEGGVEAVCLHICLICRERQEPRSARVGSPGAQDKAHCGVAQVFAQRSSKDSSGGVGWGVGVGGCAVLASKGSTPGSAPGSSTATTRTHNVEPQLVAQLVPQRVVGVVAAPHGIEVELLHQANVLQAGSSSSQRMGGGRGGGGRMEGDWVRCM
jgi:hypothetical protein